MSENVDQPKPNWIKRIEQVYESQLMLGALVALLVVANGFVTYRSTQASLSSSTTDFYADREMQKASISHLTANAKYMIDVTAYNSYRLLEDEHPELAEESLSHGSEELLVALERPGGPFDEEYDQTRYGEALAAIEAAGELYKEADQASMESERFALASAVLTIGLGATAWAALLREQSVLRFVFSVTAWVSLIAALIVGFVAS
jgi:hypothetical protein